MKCHIQTHIKRFKSNNKKKRGRRKNVGKIKEQNTVKSNVKRNNDDFLADKNLKTNLPSGNEEGNPDSDLEFIVSCDEILEGDEDFKDVHVIYIPQQGQESDKKGEQMDFIQEEQEHNRKEQQIVYTPHQEQEHNEKVDEFIYLPEEGQENVLNCPLTMGTEKSIIEDATTNSCNDDLTVLDDESGFSNIETVTVSFL